jgi:hypothetical protein
MAERKRPVRPRAEYLQALPTQRICTPDQGSDPEVRECARELGVDFQLDLKLVKDGYEFWLCTKGADRPREGVPEAWVVWHIWMVPLNPTDGEEESIMYGPDATKELQGMDYLQWLGDRMEELQALDKRSFSWDTKKQIDETKREIKQVMRTLGIDPEENLKRLGFEPPEG